jgi:nitroimidazol reductase NimA-like FMN-containing flavoprotein (pyridoxamine 5'-phosphate oxidase superfamily)
MRLKGPWSTDEVERFLLQSRIPLRLACNGALGHPVLASLWFAFMDGSLWCATQETASVAGLLRADPRCAFEVSSETMPYRGVRGRGRARLHDARGGEVLRLLVKRYLGGPTSPLAHWLLSRADSEIAIAVRPLTILSWDYQERMRPAT